MTLRKTLNIILTVVLIVSTTIIGGVTFATHYKDLAYGMFVTYRQLLPKTPTASNNSLTARISGFTRAANTHLYLKGNFEKLNARMQMKMGKQMLSFGGSTMVTTQTGHLYDLMDYVDTAWDVQLLGQLNERLQAKGIPLLYGYAHTTLYEGESLPKGVTDSNNQVADEIVAGLKAAGIPTLDSREVMKESGLPLDEMIYRTDAHWSARNAFEMYTQMVNLLNDVTTIKADKTAADINNFNIDILPECHISDLGNRIGADAIKPDDFELITPKFETSITRNIMKDKELVESTGSFEDVVLDKAMLPEAKGLTYTNCYNYYGQHPEVVYYTNDSAPEGRLLIVKDSFGTPVSSFMSLAVREVCAIDLRKTTKTIEDFVESFKPDAVMIVHCQEVMRGGQNFVFVNQE